jgi:DNA polymerase IV (archaeal DinB-like DNA polymerase)
VDDRTVTPKGRPKSLSRESAFAEPTDDLGEVEERALTLAAAVSERATRKEALYRTIGIKVVTPPFDVNTRARSLSGPVDDPDLVERVVGELLEEFEGERVRKVGVRVSNLEFGAAAQSSLDGWAGGDDAVGGSGSDDGEDGDEAAVGSTADSAERCGQASLSRFE